MSRNIIKTSILVISLLAGSAAFADNEHRSWWCGDRIMHMKHIAKDLNLDTAQVAQLKLIQEQMRATVSNKYARMQDLRVKIQHEVFTENMNPLKLDHLINQKAQLVGDFMRAQAIAQHQLYLMLNPQQKIIAEQAMNKRNAHIADQYVQCMK